MRAAAPRFQHTVIAQLMLLMAMACAPALSIAQCTNNNTNIGGPAITPNCPGVLTVPCITAGQYALVNVTSGNNYTFSTCGAAWDTQITIFNNTGGANLGYNDDGAPCGGGTQSYLAWTATFTGQLRVLVDAYVLFVGGCQSNNLCASLSITCNTPPATVTNNECAGAILLTVSDVCNMRSFTNTGATRSAVTPYPTCANSTTTGNFHDVWFRFVAPANGVVIIESAPGTMTDGDMQLVHGSCGSFTNVLCSVNDGVGNMPRIDTRCAPLIAGDTYYIRYWGRSGNTGSFGLCVRGYTNFPTPQEDCSGGLTVCSDSPITNDADYIGCSNDLTNSNHGCLAGNERQGSWYFFSPSVAGTASLTIAPTGGNVDYDFAIWGPLTTIACPPVGAPVRCSWAYPPNVPGYPAASSFQTGMRASSVDLSENASGDGFVAPLPLLVGKIYILYVDNFDINGQAFNLDWSITGGGSLDCAVLPVDFLDLQAVARDPLVDVTWATASERNSDHYSVERSSDNADFNAIGTVTAAGDAQSRNDYSFTDMRPEHGANYYRLEQVDRDGASVRTHTVVAFLGNVAQAPVLFPDPVADLLNVAFDTPADGIAGFDVVDAMGRTVHHAQASGSRGRRTEQLATHDLSPGCYFLRIRLPDGNTLQAGRFLKK